MTSFLNYFIIIKWVKSYPINKRGIFKLINNVISFKPRETNKGPSKESITDSFMMDFFDWAELNGIDVESSEFKYNAATILTVVQSLLNKKD